MFQKLRKGLKKFMNDKIEVCKEMFSNDQNRLTIGIVIIGLGIGLVASAYIHVPVQEVMYEENSEKHCKNCLLQSMDDLWSQLHQVG